jgi:hypothetical protein
MKHASPEALDVLEPLLNSVRNLPALREKSRGVFYLRSKAFLHFHEDPTGLFADVRVRPNGDFVRMRVSSQAECARFLKKIEQVCADRE